MKWEILKSIAAESEHDTLAAMLRRGTDQRYFDIAERLLKVAAFRDHSVVQHAIGNAKRHQDPSKVMHIFSELIGAFWLWQGGCLGQKTDPIDEVIDFSGELGGGDPVGIEVKHDQNGIEDELLTSELEEQAKRLLGNHVLIGVDWSVDPRSAMDFWRPRINEIRADIRSAIAKIKPGTRNTQLPFLYTEQDQRLKFRIVLQTEFMMLSCMEGPFDRWGTTYTRILNHSRKKATNQANPKGDGYTIERSRRPFVLVYVRVEREPHMVSPSRLAMAWRELLNADVPSTLAGVVSLHCSLAGGAIAFDAQGAFTNEQSPVAVSFRQALHTKNLPEIDHFEAASAVWEAFQNEIQSTPPTRILAKDLDEWLQLCRDVSGMDGSDNEAKELWCRADVLASNSGLRLQTVHNYGLPFDSPFPKSGDDMLQRNQEEVFR